jgi:hypothetical protein
MKKIMLNTFVFLLVVTSFKANAYDVDTHFYGTYSMARFAGIRHEIALKIATATQWMDESYISDPVSMIVLPDVGIKKRRLLHFPGSRLANKLTIDKLPSFLDPTTGVQLKTFTETEADHEFATEMFTEGLSEGNLIKAAAGLHTLEDSFAHAGTISELGHAHFWHHPDRPYVDEQSIEKYFKMTRSVLRAMVAIRSLLPASGVDMDLKSGPQAPNYQLNGDRLADLYENIPEVKAAISRKILNDPGFVQFALQNVFKRANNAKYIANGYEPYLNNFKPGQDAYDAAGQVIRTIPPQMIDLKSVMKDSGYQQNLSSDYILSMGGLRSFLEKVVMNLLSGIVPRPLNEYHRFEKEEDGPVWVKEMDIRVTNMRVLIQKLYGKEIFFVKNNTSSAAGFVKEITKDAGANPLALRSNGPELVTFSMQEKYKFDYMIFSFLFPQTYNYVKDDLPQATNFIIAANDLLRKDRTWMQKIGSTFSYVVDRFNPMGNRLSFYQAVKLAHQDIFTSHMVPHTNNRFYTVPSLLQKEIRNNTFKPLLTNEQVNRMGSR